MVKVKTNRYFRIFLALVITNILSVYFAPLLIELASNLHKELRKSKKTRTTIPVVKSVAFKCSHLRGNTSLEQKNLVSYIKFRLYIIAHNDFSVGIAEKWSKCMPFVEIIRIQSTPFFESYVFASLFSNKALQQEWKQLDFIGLATYKSLKFVSIEKLEVSYIEHA